MLTSQQSAAIAARGKILVSASAGAGKTTVMIKRLADILCGGADLDNVLAVTFTKKAAAQMKEKLRAELVSRLSYCSESERENIRTQLGKINSSDISTIDSFCARLVRTYFYAFDGLDASFEIAADETLLGKMKERALDNLFDRLYGNDEQPMDGDFLYLVQRLRKNRKDASLREAIIEAYSKLRIEPDYGDITARCESTFSEEGFERVCAELGDIAGERCSFYADEVRDFSYTLEFPLGGDAYFEMLDEIEDNLRLVAEEKDVFTRPLKLASHNKPRKKEENAAEDERFASFVNGLKAKYEKLFKGIAEKEEERRIFEESGKLAKIFANIVMAFDGEYSAVKREEGKLDYQDLEHLAYALVCGKEGADRDIKEQINGKYSYVFIDEYQDVNPIQDAIINAVAGGDIFKVGDLKQAIYGFRGSRSHFFSGQLRSAAKEGGCVVLPHNFRSAPAVIDFVNDVFSRIMREDLCGFDYLSEGHAMISGVQGEYIGNAEVVFFADDGQEKKQADGVYSVADDLPENIPAGAEARTIVGLIDELLQGTICDGDTGEYRPVRQGDICILTRKKNARGVNEARKELLASGYRVDGTAEQNICDLPDIRRIIGILSYIDNSEQDIPLAASLLSPLGGLCEDELAAIRIYGGVKKDSPLFRRCAESYAVNEDDGLARKLRAFYQRIDRLKKLSLVLGAARLIDEILNSDGFIAEFLQGDNLAAVRRLQAEAGAESEELSLNAFLMKLKASGYKVISPLPASSDSIKVMTMHASKGLEFPIVIIADISTGFGGDDREQIAYDEYYGFAPRFYDSEKRVYGDTLARRLFRMRSQREELKNEINLFYVACTRARSSLYVVCSEREGFDICGVPTASCYADLFDVQSLKKAVYRHICADELQKMPCGQGGKKAIGSFIKDDGLYERLKESFEFAPAEEGAGLPVKSSATKILGLNAEDEISPVMFNEEEGDTDIESGLAYHSFLQYCDFSVKDEEGIEKELARFASENLIPPERIALLDIHQLSHILALPRFDFGEGCSLYREREFLCSLTAGEYSALAQNNSALCEREDAPRPVIIQGAIDLLVVKRDGSGQITGADIIDYKYSSRKDWSLAQKYAPQLMLYKKAVALAYGLAAEDITTTIINIHACTEIPV